MKQILIYILIFAFAASLTGFSETSADLTSDKVIITQDVVASVVGPVCGNGICESGENSTNCPTDCPVSIPGGGFVDIFPPRITDIVVRPSYNSAIISWKTSKPAISQFFLGRTAEYEIETIAEIKPSTEHSVALIDLNQDTLYHFKIEARDNKNRLGFTTDKTFRTLFVPAPPPNVQNFQAVAGDGQVNLTWQNPKDPNFKGVRILRSTFFYPQDLYDGEVIYNSNGESFVDNGLINGVGYYYTAFAYDKSGKYASGAIAFATPGAPTTVPPELFPPTAGILPELKALQLSDFEFWQEGKRLPMIEGKVQAQIGPPITVKLAYEKAPKVLKTILVTLEKPQDRNADVKSTDQSGLENQQASLAQALATRRLFSFILRINGDKTAYEARIFPPDSPITYPLYISVMDFKNQVRKRMAGEIEILLAAMAPAPQPVRPGIWRWLPYILLLLILLLAAKKLKKLRNKAAPASQAPSAHQPILRRPAIQTAHMPQAPAQVRAVARSTPQRSILTSAQIPPTRQQDKPSRIRLIQQLSRNDAPMFKVTL